MMTKGAPHASAAQSPRVQSCMIPHTGVGTTPFVLLLLQSHLSHLPLYEVVVVNHHRPCKLCAE